jgi:hypothetical protein
MKYSDGRHPTVSACWSGYVEDVEPDDGELIAKFGGRLQPPRQDGNSVSWRHPLTRSSFH